LIIQSLVHHTPIRQLIRSAHKNALKEYVMKITVSINERTAKAANEMGISLSQLVRNYLELLTKKNQSSSDFNDFLQLSGQGNSKGRKFDRDELHERT